MKSYGYAWKKTGSNNPYISAEVDMGALGKLLLFLFENKKPNSNESPAYYIRKRSPEGTLQNCGSLWVKTSASGSTYLSGILDFGLLGYKNIMLYELDSGRDKTIKADYVIRIPE
jgi:uncharacterized protein (DUF736 family)